MKLNTHPLVGMKLVDQARVDSIRKEFGTFCRAQRKCRGESEVFECGC